MPPEFCEFGSTWPKCRDWMSANLPDMFAKLSLDAKGTGEAAKQTKEAKPEQPAKGGPKPKVTY